MTALVALAAWTLLVGICLAATMYLADRYANPRGLAEVDAGLDDLLDDLMVVAVASGVVAPKPDRPTRTVTFRCDAGRWTRGGAA